MMSKDLTRLAAAMLLGAVLAFPAGLWLGGHREAARPPPGNQSAAIRNVFSPSIRDDAFFLERQRQNASALEAHCRRTGNLCGEARQARKWLEQQAGE